MPGSNYTNGLGRLTQGGLPQVSEAFCLVLIIGVDWNALAVRTESTAVGGSRLALIASQKISVRRWIAAVQTQLRSQHPVTSS